MQCEQMQKRICYFDNCNCWHTPCDSYSRSSASVYYTERKPKNKLERGRPGNKARNSLQIEGWEVCLDESYA